jgi:septum formation protein
MRLILASASPRRAELLSAAGFEFDVLPADVDETPGATESAETYTLRVARDKARRVAASIGDSAASVLGADTEVVVDGCILGKPATPDDAARMLRVLSGRAHDVLTAVVVCAGGRELSEVVTTRVEFARMTDEDVDRYVATGEPMGKAGAYAIQGYAARFIDRIDGSWSNVVGLPIHAVQRLLRQLRAG